MSTGPKLLRRAMSESMVQLPLGSMWMCVVSGGPRDHVRWNQRAMLSRPCLSLTLGKLALPLTGNFSKSTGPCMLERWPPPHTTSQDELTLRAYM